MDCRITPSPLPGFDSPRIQKLGWRADSDLYRVYNNIFQAAECAHTTTNGEGDSVFVRFAGFLLLELAEKPNIFGIHAGAKLISWLSSHPQDSCDGLLDVIVGNGKLLCNKLFRALRTTCSEPSTPLGSSDEILTEFSNQDQEALKQKVLFRDGYRCVVTGIADRVSLWDNPKLREQMPTDIITLRLDMVRIIDETIMQNNDTMILQSGKFTSSETYASSTARAILDMFGCSHLVEALMKADGFNGVWNLLVLEKNLHSWFDGLELWFEHTEKLHRYKMCVLYDDQEDFIRHIFVGADRHIVGSPIYVEFNAQFPQAPPPDPKLLALHAACARAMHISGATELFDRMEQEAEEMSTPSSDGSSNM